ncbi:hypothetical protein GIB67_006414 [Kingdonia uniflora]|uniref:Cytochrome c oxidase copper chaperone n=1 Tax=Kingdonia uniflora TaxID=39325 RepID=A0A7J7P1I5_9MAGN|nr:hypothetical protein GIB67_006414 [Kingdonia uniflora]
MEAHRERCRARRREREAAMTISEKQEQLALRRERDRRRRESMTEEEKAMQRIRNRNILQQRRARLMTSSTVDQPSFRGENGIQRHNRTGSSATRLSDIRRQARNLQHQFPQQNVNVQAMSEGLETLGNSIGIQIDNPEERSINFNNMEEQMPSQVANIEGIEMRTNLALSEEVAQMQATAAGSIAIDSHHGLSCFAEMELKQVPSSVAIAPTTTNDTEQNKVSSPVAIAPANETKPKKKICCACPDTKRLRDECIVEHGEDACSKWIQAHLQCLRAEGFKV